MADKATGEGGAGEAARLRVLLDQAHFDLELSRQNARRLERELRLIEHRLAQTEADQASVQSRLDERNDYVEAIHRSAGWKLLQKARDLFGRRW
jgi:hypothetical protein